MLQGFWVLSGILCKQNKSQDAPKEHLGGSRPDIFGPKSRRIHVLHPLNEGPEKIGPSTEGNTFYSANYYYFAAATGSAAGVGTGVLDDFRNELA